jgi:signal transduction histidine kinase
MTDKVWIQRSPAQTLGLIGIKERTFALGGKYDLKSERGKGTGVQVSIPYENNLNKP